MTTTTSTTPKRSHILTAGILAGVGGILLAGVPGIPLVDGAYGLLDFLGIPHNPPRDNYWGMTILVALFWPVLLIYFMPRLDQRFPEKPAFVRWVMGLGMSYAIGFLAALALAIIAW